MRVDLGVLIALALRLHTLALFREAFENRRAIVHLAVGTNLGAFRRLEGPTSRALGSHVPTWLRIFGKFLMIKAFLERCLLIHLKSKLDLVRKRLMFVCVRLRNLLCLS